MDDSGKQGLALTKEAHSIPKLTVLNIIPKIKVLNIIPCQLARQNILLIREIPQEQ